MKKQTNQTKRAKRRFTTFKPLVLFTLFGLSAVTNAAISPFAGVPLHLQNETQNTSSGGVKPNIVLQIDDSGSMSYLVNIDAPPHTKYWEGEKEGEIYTYPAGSFDAKFKEMGWKQKTAPRGETRLAIAKRALNKVLNTPEYTNKANFGLLTLWNNENKSHEYARAVMNGQREFAMTVDEMKDVVNSLRARQATPALERYFDAAALLERAIKYRCQKSYIILFSDGDSMSLTARPTVTNNQFKWSTERKVDRYSFFTLFAHNFNYGLNYGGAPRRYDFPDNMTDYLKKPSVKTYISYNDQLINWQPMFTYNAATGQYTWNLTRSSNLLLHSPNGWSAHPDMLPFAANMFARDLKTASNSNPAVDAAGKSWDDDKDYNGQNFKTQNILSYAVGFGAGLSAVGFHSLNGMSTGNNYQALNASTEKELDDAFAKIFTSINLQNELKPPFSSSSVAPAAIMDSTGAGLTGSAGVVLDLKNAASEIRIYQLKQSNNGSNIYKVDDSKYGVPDFSQRKVLFNEGGANNKVSWLEEYQGNNDAFNIQNDKNPNEWKDSLIPWLMRSKPDAEIAAMSNNSIKYRVRGVNDQGMDTRNMGHVLSTSLTSFGDNKFKRQQYLVTAANDGMVYLFESKNSDTHPYELKLNYMPAGMQRESPSDTVMKYYKNLASADYVTNSTSNPHQYLLNGDMEVRETASHLPHRRVFMSGNMGQAGRGSYSINLAGKNVAGQSVGVDGSDWRSSVPLFETEKTLNNPMGYTIGRPGIGRLSLNRSVKFEGSGETAKATMTTDLYNLYYATFVNSGVRNPTARENTESALYIYSTLGEENVGLTGGSHGTIGHRTGQQLAKLVASPDGGGLAEPTLLDVDLDGTIDLVYAGDYKGNMYRFDLRAGGPDTWKVERLFTTKDNRPITSAPAVSYLDENTFVVVFGTGSDLYQEDLTNTDTQTVYGIYDFIGNEKPTTTTSGVGNLLKQELNKQNGGTAYSVRELSKNAIDTQKHKGWYFDLLETSERVTIRPVLLLKTVVLTTRMYSMDTPTSHSTGGGSNDVCEPQSTVQTTAATSWVLQFRSDTGGRLPSKGEKDANHFPFVDFTRASAESDFTTRTEESLASGFQVPNIGLSSLLMIAGNDAQVAGGVGMAVNSSGNVGGGPFTKDIDPNANPPKRQFCFNTAQKTGDVILGNSSNTDTAGMGDTAKVFYEQCSGVSLRRISWREIF